MPVHSLSPGGALSVERGEVVVAIPVFGALDLFEACLRSVVAHTGASVQVLVADDATPGGGVAELLREHAGEHRVHHLLQPRNAGFVENVDSALRAAAPADVVVLNSDCEVAAGWLEGLRDAARSDTRVATASALTNRGSILSVPERNVPRADLPAGVSLEEAARAVRERSLRVRPRIPTAIGHCFYVRREALELVGGLDRSFSPGYGEEVDFSQRCVLRGLVHVAADDVLVLHRGGASFGAAGPGLADEHERVVEARYPYYRDAVRTTASAERGPLPDAIATARRALGPLRVTIDGGALGPRTMGTQVHTLGLIRALAAEPGLRLRVAIPRDASAAVRAALDEAGVERLHLDEADAGAERDDVVHRPSQAAAPKDLARLHALGERIVVSQLDLIAYSNPGYFEGFARWDEHRALTRQALAFADAVVVSTRTVLEEAVAEQLAERELVRVVPPGVDDAARGAGGAPQPPAGLGSPGRGPLLVCLGADFRHKNRLFALDLLAELRTRGTEARLVLAGPAVAHGSSRGEEDAWLAAQPDHAAAVTRIGAVSEEERAWLLRESALVLYPTVAEGFGLVPFEAAAAGTPCMWAPVSALAEVLPPELATVVPWSTEATAERALALLGGEGEALRLAAAVREHGARYTWAGAASALAGVYREVVERPPRPARAAYFGTALSDVAMSLVGPGGYLPPEAQRALLAVAARPRLRRPAFAALDAAYRALRAAGRARRTWF